MGARTWFDGAVAPETTPAREWAEARPGSGTEHPDDLPDTAHLSIERTFCFADLTGFTRYTRENGPHAAVGLLEEFRAVSRDVAAKRGVDPREFTLLPFGGAGAVHAAAGCDTCYHTVLWTRTESKGFAVLVENTRGQWLRANVGHIICSKHSGHQNLATVYEPLYPQQLHLQVSNLANTHPC